ncbi:hypothetical protein [Spirosoma rhododendri]|uniref:HAD-IG family 5'-nucleotidase n=1 Tax=Spirosoma rhododendri TaxID=2728024 RepID=A0A7L5DV70_9BACT|nr:hypothetical protein [Spirosoma rhododendri]QJD80498.1 HAD-IG family 5'-nucleotidase [Spirosoma rhododendri]
MSVQEIEQAIEALPEKDVHTLADWLIERRNQLWDQQIKEDADSGRLDALLDELKEDIRQGRTSPL